MAIFRSFAFLGIAAATAEEASAVFSEVSGKVEYQVPGSDWKPARIGDKVHPGDIVSTGFKSTATASVRGTAFEFDGINLIVDRGSVQLATPTMQFRHVEAGQFSMIAAGGVVPPPAARRGASHRAGHEPSLLRRQRVLRSWRAPRLAPVGDETYRSIESLGRPQGSELDQVVGISEPGGRNK